MTKNPRRTVALCAAGLMQAASAEASPLIEAMGGFGDAGGQQARNLASGASAAYFNPALLGEAPAGITLGAAVLGLRIGVALAGRADGRYDLPAGLANATRADGSRLDHYPIPTETLQLGREESPSQSATTARPRQGAGSGTQTLSYEAIGLVVHALEERLAVGVYGLIPNGDFIKLRSFYPDEREQFTTNSLHAELYGDRLSALSFGFGVAYRFHERFSLGVGTGINLRANALAPAYVADAAQLDSLLLNVDVKVKAGLAPHAGFAWRPLDRWRVTGTVHAQRQLEIGADVRFLLSTGLEQTTALRLLYDWMPWQVGLGTSVDVLSHEDTTLTLAASTLYGRWSQYVDRHGERPAPQFGWYDTFTNALGARLATGAWTLGVDVEYKPTPVPLQRGRSNYVDNDRIGASHTLEYAIPIGHSQLKLGAQLSGFWMLDRFARKLTTPTFADGINRTPALVKDELPDDAQIGLGPAPGAAGLQTNNPGWPGFSSKGWLAGAGLYAVVTL
jgi:long-chain fatty acid transport protein